MAMKNLLTPWFVAAAITLAALAFFLTPAPAKAACLVSAGCTGQTSFTQGLIIQGSDALRLTSTATTTPVIGNGLSYSGTFGDLVGGIAGTLTATLGTTISPNELVGAPGANLVLYTNGAGTGFAGKATSTPSLSSSFSYSGTLGQFIDGVSGTLSIAANGIASTMLANADFGSFTCATGVCTIDAASITNAMLANSTISGVALGGSLFAHTHDTTLSGTSYNGSAAVSDWGLNLAHSNAWTVLQSFALASTSQLSVFNKAYFGGTATTTIDSTGNITIPSGSGLFNTGRSDGCASWSSGQLTSLGTACGTSSGGITSITLGGGLDGASPITTTGTITAQVGTSTVPNVSGIAYWTGNATPSTLGTVATTTFTPSAEFTVGGTIGAFVGGANSSLTLATNGIAYSKLVQAGANTILGNPTGATANVQAFATSSLGIAISDTTGTLLVPRGGTGQVSFTSGNLLYGSGSGAIQNVATSSATCTSASGITCSAHTVVGSVAPTFALSAIPNSSLANSTISGIALGSTLGALSATNATLTFSGSYTGAAAQTVGLNLANPNAWTGLQQFNANASTTQLSVYTKAYFGGTATTTIDSTGNIVIPSGSGLTNTGRSDGCATWSSAVLTSTGVACGSGGGGGGDPFLHPIAGSSATSTLIFSIGTTTFPTTPGTLTLANSTITKPLLQLSAGAGFPAWSAFNEQGNFYFATTSDTTGATTSPMTPFALTAGTNGARLGINIGAPRATLDLYEQNGTGETPSIMLGGNTAGDTDIRLYRRSNNDSANNDYFGIATSTIAGTFAAPVSEIFTASYDGKIGIGSTTPYASLSINAAAQTFPYLAIGSTTGNVYTVSPATKLYPQYGLGTSTPWGAFSIEDAAYDNLHPLFTINTTENDIGQAFNVSATSTVLTKLSTMSGMLNDLGVRVGVGIYNYFGIGGLLDQFVVQGRINTAGWLSAICDEPIGHVQIISDGAIGCAGFSFAEDSTATLTALTTGGQLYGELSTTAANDGAGIFANSNASTGWLISATSTPVMEVEARINTVQNATTTSFYIGYFNVNDAGSTFETLPTSGCYFTASSTQADWRAVCRSASVETNVDTGIASSTVLTGTGGFRLFRIEMDNAGARFYMKANQATNLVKVATIATNVPTTVALNAGAYYARTQGTAAVNFDLFHIRLWWRDWLPDL